METTSDSAGKIWLTRFSAKGVRVGLLTEVGKRASIQTTQLYIDVNDEQMRRAA